MKWGFSKNDKVSIIFDHVTIYPKCFFFFLIINKLEKKEKEKKIIMWYGAIIKFDIDTILFVLLYSYYLMWLELPIYVYRFQLVQLI